MQEVEEWVSLNEAATQLGVSVQTLRRRIKDDQVRARKVDSPYGPAWEVSLSKVERVVNTEGSDQGGSSTVENELSGFDEGGSSTVDNGLSTHGMVEALQIIQQLQQEVVAKAEVASLWQGRAEVLTMQLAQAQDTIKALEAPKVEEKPKAWWKLW